MIIDATDRLYYHNALEYVVEQLEITRNFAKYNGLTSFTSEDVSEQTITYVKNWLLSHHGEQWLSTLGYSKAITSYSGCITLVASGTISLADYCPVCSGIYNQTDGTVCECCGRTICRPCSTVVDSRYGVEWCESCVQREALTNILPHSE
jgi:hypothetical protein